MPDYGSRLGNAASGAASGAAIGSIIPGLGTGIGAAIGGGVGLLSGLFSKSDSEIRKEQLQNYLKSLAEMRNKSLARLNEQNSKNIGLINQYTTGRIKQGQGDISARAASHGRGADQADMLALNGQITSSGSNAIQNEQTAADEAQRKLMDYYDQQQLNAEASGAFAPSDPSVVDVLGSIAPAALQYGMNKQLLGAPNQQEQPSQQIIQNPTTDISTLPSYQPIPQNIQDQVYQQDNQNNVDWRNISTPVNYRRRIVPSY